MLDHQNYEGWIEGWRANQLKKSRENSWVYSEGGDQTVRRREVSKSFEVNAVLYRKPVEMMENSCNVVMRARMSERREFL